MRRVLVCAVLLLAACGGGGSGGEQQLTGTVTVKDDDISGDWDDCSGTGGYDDIRAGLNVTVLDGEGAIVGTGSARNLTEADAGEMTLDKAIEDPDAPMTLELSAAFAPALDGECTLVFEVPVKDAEFYVVKAGGRGELSYSHDELEERGWFVQLSLGS